MGRTLVPIDNIIQFFEGDEIHQVKPLIDRRKQVGEEMAKLTKELADLDREIQRLLCLMESPSLLSSKRKNKKVRSLFSRGGQWLESSGLFVRS